MEKLLARISKALGLSDDEIAEALAPDLDADTEAVIKGAEAALGVAKLGGGCAECNGLPEYEPDYIAKRDFSYGRRKELAGTGAAMSGGGFPIENCGDVKNAVQAIGRAKDRASAMAHIKSRAKSLGCTGSLPDSWGPVKKAAESSAGPGRVRNMDTDETTVEETADTIEDRVEALEDTIEKLPGQIVKAIREGQKDEEPEVTPAELSSKLDKLASDTAKAVEEIGAKVEKLAEGESSQGPDEIAKAESVSKAAYEARGLPADLAGIV